MQEFEVKYLDINPEAIEIKLVEIGAKKLFDRMYRVRIFDYPDLRLNNDESAWVRLRDEGDKITLSFKQRLGAKVSNGKSDKAGLVNDDGMKEVEVVVDNFDSTAEIFYSIGLIDKFYEEKRRIRYMLDDIEFDIDYMPGLDPFLEIESGSMDRVEEGIRLLGLDTNDKKIFSAFQIYALKGINMLDYEGFTFKDGPVLRRKDAVDGKSK